MKYIKINAVRQKHTFFFRSSTFRFLKIQKRLGKEPVHTSEKYKGHIYQQKLTGIVITNRGFSPFSIFISSPSITVNSRKPLVKCVLTQNVVALLHIVVTGGWRNRHGDTSFSSLATGLVSLDDKPPVSGKKTGGTEGVRHVSNEDLPHESTDVVPTPTLYSSTMVRFLTQLTFIDVKWWVRNGTFNVEKLSEVSKFHQCSLAKMVTLSTGPPFSPLTIKDETV